MIFAEKRGDRNPVTIKRNRILRAFSIKPGDFQWTVKLKNRKVLQKVLLNT